MSTVGPKNDSNWLSNINVNRSDKKPSSTTSEKKDNAIRDKNLMIEKKAVRMIDEFGEKIRIFFPKDRHEYAQKVLPILAETYKDISKKNKSETKNGKVINKIEINKLIDTAVTNIVKITGNRGDIIWNEMETIKRESDVNHLTEELFPEREKSEAADKSIDWLKDNYTVLQKISDVDKVKITFERSEDEIKVLKDGKDFTKELKKLCYNIDMDPRQYIKYV